MRYALTQAPQSTFANGGETPHSRQLFGRVMQGYQPHGPRIESAITGIQPGELRPIWLDAAGAIFAMYRPDGTKYASLSILDWTPYCAWHEPTRQLIHGGRRLRCKVIVYSDDMGDWREEAMPAELGRDVGTGHWYGPTAVNPDTGLVYLRGWELEPETWAWRKLPSLPKAAIGSNCYAWADGHLAQYGGDGRVLTVYDPATDTWPVYVSGMPSRSHAIVGYHPQHAKLLIAGGTNTERTAVLAALDGTWQQVSDCPGDLRMSTCSWIVPHASGCYLVRTVEPYDLYAYWPNEDRWDLLGPAPDAALQSPTIAHYRDDIYLNVATKGLYAWRLPSI